MRADALILAGARNKGALRKYAAEEHEALIRLGDTPMVEYVIRAVKEAHYTDEITLVGPRKQISKLLNIEVERIINAEDSLISNIIRGLKEFEPEEYVLLITGDIPLITAEIVDEFLQSCDDGDQADIYYPIISRQQNMAKYPGVKRTYVNLAEGSFTGGNMVLIKPRVLLDSVDWLQKVYTLRKKPWRLSKLLGMKIVFKFLTGNLSLSEIEQRVSELLGYKGKGMIIKHPEVGFDVDKPSDLKLMREKYI